MACNTYKPHVYVIPEDKANRQMVLGFLRHPEVQGLNARQVDVRNSVGDWKNVIEKIEDTYIAKIKNDPNAHVLGIIDCDGEEDRIVDELEKFPDDVQGRIFLLGTLDEPETFRTEVGKKLQEIGWQLADECLHQKLDLWEHPQLAHIVGERQRVMDVLRRIVFDS